MPKEPSVSTLGTNNLVISLYMDYAWHQMEVVLVLFPGHSCGL